MKNSETLRIIDKPEIVRFAAESPVVSRRREVKLAEHALTIMVKTRQEAIEEAAAASKAEEDRENFLDNRPETD